MVRVNVHSGKCPFGEMLLGELSIGELTVRGTVLRGSVRRGNVFGELSVEEKFFGEMFVGKLS